jgi:hypothetical protein
VIVTKEHILREIRRTAEANGGTPLGRLSFFTETGIREADWHGKYWARWNDVLREAGFGPNALVEARDDDTLLERLAALAIELGRIPVNSEMRLKKRSDPSFPNDKTYSRFGSKAQLLTRLRAFASSNPMYSAVGALLDAAPALTEESEKEKVTDAGAEIGTVYLLRSGRFHKIGRSNSAGRREYEVGLQLPEKVVLVHSIQTDDPVGIEAYWHRRFADRRKNGEWFALSAADISAFRRRKFM